MTRRDTLSFKNGFTIIELVIVVIIIGILAAVVLVAYTGIQSAARDKSVLSDLDALDGIETRYGLKNSTAGKAWYSGTGEDNDLSFSPSAGNVIDIVVNSKDYCIRGYNPSAATYKTLVTAAIKESTAGACAKIPASAAALSGSITGPTYVWTKQIAAGADSWADIASSSDGSKIVASSYGGYLSTSTDGGATWTQRTSTGTQNWTSVASSSDGSKIYALTRVGSQTPGSLYSSTDAGLTWISQAGPCMYGANDISSSSDGSKLFVACGSAHDGTNVANAAVSSNSGTSWSTVSPSTSNTNQWDRVASSSDGTKLAIGGEDDYIYTSTNSGATWTKRTPSGPSTIGEWVGLAMSSDGTKLVTVDYSGSGSGGLVYTSTDSGVSWTAQNSLGSASWTGASISSTGSVIIVMQYNSSSTAYNYSTDGGVTWQLGVAPIPNRAAQRILSPNNGQKLIIAGSTSYSDPNSYIYTSNYQ